MKRVLSIVLLLAILTLFTHVHISADSELSDYGIPYQTYTLNAEGRRIPTQTAYVPVGVFGRDLGLNGPEDFDIEDDLFYIADTGSKRLLITDSSGAFVDEIRIPEFVQPMGVFVKDETIYVADKGAKAVFLLDLAGNLKETFVRPTSPIFGANNDFVPLKVAVDSSDSIYVIGEGSTAGVIQLNYAGEFIGYIGINAVPLSLRRILYDFFVGDSDLAQSLPSSPTNIAIGHKGSLLTTNQNAHETFKRLNISGINTLRGDTRYPERPPTDVYMSDDLYVYLVGEDGTVYEYETNGRLLFQFNTRDTGLTQTLGLTLQPRSILTDSFGNLYVLDKGYNQVMVYQKTVFVDLVHQAVTMYNDGRYLESKPLFEEILRQNSSFALAHSAMGESLSKEERYEEALESFYDARDYEGYSDTFWEIRNAYIQDHLGRILILLIGTYVFLKISLLLFRKSPAYSGYLERKRAFMNRLVPHELRYALNVFKRPFELFYGIKRQNQASYLTGAIVLSLFVLVYLLDNYLTGFLFRDPNLNSVLVELAIVSGVFLLYISVNYLVSTLNDGEGRFKDVFISTAYMLIPYVLLTLPMTFISNYLTYNESFIFSFYHQIILVWTFLLLFMSVKGVHNYTFFETIRNVLIILFGMFIVILIGLLIYAFMGQLIEFVISLVREVIYRV